MKAGKWFLLLVMALGIARSVVATVPPEDDARIRQRIEDEMNAVLDQLVDRQRYARFLGFTYPVKQPVIGLDGVQKAARLRIEKLAREKYPDSWVDEQLRADAEKYRLWELGEDVSFTTLAGKKYSEKLREIQDSLIKVGPNKVRKEDLPPEVRVHVDAALAAKMKAQDRHKLQRQLAAQRAEYVRDVQLTQEEEFYDRNGYIKVRGKWQSKYDFFESVIEAERQRYDRFLRRPLEYKHYYNAGYRYYDGDWYPLEEANRLAADAAATREEPAGPNPLAALGRKLKVVFGATGDDTGKGGSAEKKPTAAANAGQASDALWGIAAVVAVLAVAAVMLGIIVALAGRRKRRR